MGTENIRGSASETLSLVQFGPVVLIGNDQSSRISLATLALGTVLLRVNACHIFW